MNNKQQYFSLVTFPMIAISIFVLFFFIAGLFSFESSAGIAFFYILLLLYLSKNKYNYDKYFFNINSKVLNYKVIFSLIFL